MLLETGANTNNASNFPKNHHFSRFLHLLPAKMSLLSLETAIFAAENY